MKGMNKLLKTRLNDGRAVVKGGKGKRGIELGELRKERVSELSHESVVPGICVEGEKRLLMNFHHIG